MLIYSRSKEQICWVILHVINYLPLIEFIKKLGLCVNRLLASTVTQDAAFYTPNLKSVDLIFCPMLRKLRLGRRCAFFIFSLNQHSRTST